MRWKRMLVTGCAVGLTGCSVKANAPEELPPIEVRGDPAIGQVDSRYYEAREKVWVCHRGRWQDVSGAAAAAHSRHGDRVSETARERQSGC